MASGSYANRPPPPPVSVSVDSNKYNLGKQVYSGKAPLGTSSSDLAAQQGPRLKELQDKLPKAAQKNTNLPDLAGKLTPGQMSALQYYLEVRYKVK
jgi:hypothetical protein